MYFDSQDFTFLTHAWTSTLVATTTICIELLDCRTDPDPLAAGEGSEPVRQSGNSIWILVVTTGVEVRAGVRKGKVRESKCEIKFDTKTGLGANLSFAT